MCYHVNTPTHSNLSKILKPDVEILPYPELQFSNGFAQPLVPVMKNDNQNVVSPWPWSGFIIPGGKFALTTLNATCEKVFESRLYGDSIRHRRCLMFVQGMYEWSIVGMTKKNEKIPYYIDRIDEMPFALAGIWKDWGIVDGKPHQSLSIITTPANEFMTHLRPDVPRQTLILDKNKWEQWLDPKATELQVKDLFQIYPDGNLKITQLDKSPLKK